MPDLVLSLSALERPELRVSPPPAGGTAAALRARMARFSDGDAHRRRRQLVVDVLPADPPGAVPRTRGALPAGAGRFDVMPLARTVPVAVLAAALGVGDVERAAAATGELSEALAPRTGPLPAGVDGDRAATELCALLAPGRSGDEEVAVAASVLFQARDATAALLGAVLAGSPGPVDVAAVEPPVSSTRRQAAEAVRVGGLAVPAGADVVVPLPRSAPFGVGPHACPGAALAVRLAGEIAGAVWAAGWRAVAGEPRAYEPRPNLRLPARLLLERP